MERIDRGICPSAYRDGWNARERGWQVTDCPYSQSWLRSKSWLTGWADKDKTIQAGDTR